MPCPRRISGLGAPATVSHPRWSLQCDRRIRRRLTKLKALDSPIMGCYGSFHDSDHWTSQSRRSFEAEYRQSSDTTLRKSVFNTQGPAHGRFQRPSLIPAAQLMSISFSVRHQSAPVDLGRRGHARCPLSLAQVGAQDRPRNGIGLGLVTKPSLWRLSRQRIHRPRINHNEHRPTST